MDEAYFTKETPPALLTSAHRLVHLLHMTAVAVQGLQTQVADLSTRLDEVSSRLEDVKQAETDGIDDLVEMYLDSNLDDKLDSWANAHIDDYVRSVIRDVTVKLDV